MNEAFLVGVWLAICMLWRLVSGATLIQRGIHICGPVAVLFQWYTIFFIGLGLLVGRTFYDFVVFEYLKYNFLTEGNFVDEPGFILGLSADDPEQLQITFWLRIFALGAPVAGVLAGAVVVYHVIGLVWSGYQRNRQESRQLPWKASVEENTAYFVLAMPLVFVLMAIRSEIRCLAVMTGSCWLPYHGQQNPPITWEQLKTAEMMMFDIDLEVGSFFQFCTVFAFGRMCVMYLRDAPDQYRWALKMAGLQGVYLYVLAGVARSLLDVAALVLTDRYKNDAASAATIAEIREKALAQLGPVFTVSTLLCVYNMFVLGKMEDLKNALGNANMKFQGVRALVLISQIQLQVLLGLSVGSNLYLAAQKLPPRFQDEVQGWHLSTYRAKLWHASLLCYECFLVVLFNYWVWGTKNNFRKLESTTEGGVRRASARELRSEADDEGAAPLRVPLLA